LPTRGLLTNLVRPKAAGRKGLTLQVPDAVVASQIPHGSVAPSFA
jgi:hypothetical protein